MESTWYIILNPVAGQGAAKKKWPLIAEQLQIATIPYVIHFTESSGHAINLVTNAITQQYRKILAIGGDGTNNEVVNGILSQNLVPSTDITYALFPIGTGNDWVKHYKIPTQLSQWFSYLKKGKTSLQDIGLVKYQAGQQRKQRYFTNVAGMAYDGFIAKTLSEKKQPVTNQLVYLSLVFRCLFRYKLQPLRITFDEGVYEGYCYTINVGICKYSGGGMQFVPHAIADDGLLALTIAGKLSKLSVLLNTPRFYTGTIDQHPKVETYQSKKISVEALGNQEAELEVDGEFLGTTPVQYHILPKALKIIIP
ncbi:MAG: diacylglycerol kinase family protein [Saprospiraceae bacterium]